MNGKPLAYSAYEELADSYAAQVDTKPTNAYYDRPAMYSLLPNVNGRRVLDAGCGPGVYAEELVSRGARVVACDVSERMLELAAHRLDGTVDLRCVNLEQPLSMFADAEFDLVIALLSLDHIADWRPLFAEFVRILKPGGQFLYSCSHPFFEADYFDTKEYFNVEHVEYLWTGFGKTVSMPTYRRSLEAVIEPLLHVGFVLERMHEPRPTSEFEAADPERYKSLMHRPSFLCVRARKPR
ncbi:MAG: class I SAM-dependent methyltransferase [Planctomycetota bacterium]|jgi:SAM-dependent methyltransferase